jgi:ribonuclease P protein component
MLPKNKRLNLKKDFKWVVSGKRFETKDLKIYLKVSDGLAPKVGISLSKKELAQAADRNRAKRLVSEAVKKIYPALSKGANLIIIPKKGVLSASIEALSSQLKIIN